MASQARFQSGRRLAAVMATLLSRATYLACEDLVGTRDLGQLPSHFLAFPTLIGSDLTTWRHFLVVDRGTPIRRILRRGDKFKEEE